MTETQTGGITIPVTLTVYSQKDEHDTLSETVDFTITITFCDAEFPLSLASLSYEISLNDLAQVLHTFESNDKRICASTSFNAVLDKEEILSDAEPPALLSF